jgi:sigma-B regulation protein RsbU (phosphoserine phosphatase)
MARRGRLKAFWASLSEGLSLQELWSQFRRETRSSYRLYASELEGRFDQTPGRRRWTRMVRELFWAMLMKLSPPRRICLLLALVLILWGFTTERHGYALVGSLAVLGLLGLELADRVAMKRDLQIAREIQSWLVPQAAPQVEGVDIAFATRPANTVAGDYYDAFLRPAPEPAGPRLMLVVADVAGKSMPAALLMATFQSSLRTLVQETLPLTDVIRRLNRYCCDHSLEGRRFTTAFVAELDCATGSLAYVNAGHNAPVLRRADGSLETLKAGGLPLGIDAAAAYESGRVTLGRGDVLLVYTDGVVEAQNLQTEEFGEARLDALMRGPRAANAGQTLASLMAAVDAFTGEAARYDDVTALVLHYGQG